MDACWAEELVNELKEIKKQLAIQNEIKIIEMELGLKAAGDYFTENDKLEIQNELTKLTIKIKWNS